MALAVAAYVSAWTWNEDFQPWPPQPIYVYEIFEDGTWSARGEGTYDPNSEPYGYSLPVPIDPPTLDIARAPPSARPRLVVASDGNKSSDTHRLVWADLPEDFDYASGSIYAGVDAAYGGVDDYYVNLHTFDTGDLYFPATAVQLIDALPTPFTGPSFPPRNLVLFALAGGVAPPAPPFWTELVGTKETP